MGTKINVQSGQNSQYVQSVKVMCRIIMERLFSPIKFFDLTFFLSKDYYIQRKALKILHGFTMGVINSKQKTPINTTTKKMAFLDLLLKISRDENALSVDEIREEVDTFMFEVIMLLSIFANYLNVSGTRYNSFWNFLHVVLFS